MLVHPLAEHIAADSTTSITRGNKTHEGRTTSSSAPLQEAAEHQASLTRLLRSQQCWWSQTASLQHQHAFHDFSITNCTQYSSCQQLNAQMQAAWPCSAAIWSLHNVRRVWHNILWTHHACCRSARTQTCRHMHCMMMIVTR
jgi:hypothetical protein